MIHFNVFAYDKFVTYAARNNNGNISTTNMLQLAGYKSARYNGRRADNSWSMDEKDYTMFVLKWG